jgi:ATP-dependent RNA helicase DeaD
MKTTFTALGVSPVLNEALMAQGIQDPTPIQVLAIPEIMAGRDLIGEAQTGTGKTLAFLLPIFDLLDPALPHVQALILTPTRELAIQITAEAKKLAQHRTLRLLAAYGGQDIQAQIRKLEGAAQIVVGTPGRLLDHLRRGTISFDHLKCLVLDEADQMLHIGFQNEVEMILKRTPKNRQTLCFSATMPQNVKRLSLKHQKDPVHVAAQAPKVTLEDIEQFVVETTDRQKRNDLFDVLRKERPFMAILFCRTKYRADALHAAMIQEDFSCELLHGDLTQARREKVMKAFRKMEFHYLIATDVAARGLDIEGITHVINYDIPADAESYIHRIGRTGRAGEKGRAITFVAPKDKPELHQIESGIQQPLTRYALGKSETRHPESRHNTHSEEKPSKKGKTRQILDPKSKRRAENIAKNKARKSTFGKKR